MTVSILHCAALKQISKTHWKHVGRTNSFLASCMLRHISPNGFCQQIDVLKCLKMQLLNNYFRKWANNLPYITANSCKFMTLVVMKAILIINNICDFTLKACSTNLLLASSWFLQK